MIDRRAFTVMMTGGSLLGCEHMSSSASASETMDDGVFELTPEYAVTHMQGEPHCDVYATFNANAIKRNALQLRKSSSVTVNGEPLKETAHPTGTYYKARLPATKGSFVFTFTRVPGQAMTHSFEFPELDIIELPKVYVPYQELRVPVHYREPPQYASDTYGMSIHGGPIRFDLTSTKKRKDNRYEFDRVPNVRDGALVFKHILDRAPPPGMYRAEIYRQQHFVLGEMSDASRTGWARLTNTQRFQIEVK